MKNFIVTILFLTAIAGHAETITGRVVKVSDGDSIIVLEGNTQHEIRLLGIDAPEKEQPFGHRSKIALANNVAGKTVEVEYSKRDSDQHITGKVIYMGYDINLRQLELGMAWHLKQDEAEQNAEDSSKYAQAEHVAQQNKLGLWKQATPQAPWEYRKAKPAQ